MSSTNWESEDFADLDVTEKLNTILAAAAAFAVETGDGVIPESAEEVQDGAEFVIPMLIPEGVESGDGRKIAENALTTRDLPIPLLWQPSTGDGHNGSFIVGRIDSVDRVEGGLGNARGVFDSGPYGREAQRLVGNKMLRGVSADLDEFEANVDGQEVEDMSKITSEKMTISKARVMAGTLVAKPSFQQCTIQLASEENMTDNIPIQDGVYEETPPEDEAADFALSTLIASAAPVAPPTKWFETPELDGPTPITVTDDGQVFGHIATWDTNHVGLNNVRPPRSRTNYAYFRTGIIKTEEGEDVAVGQLTLLGGHAPLDADAFSAVKHYDDTMSAVADVTAGEDQFGIWVAGGLRPSVTAEQVRVFRASAPSGDWRPINGQLELVAVCQVNVPGFPVARARVASGSVMALVAAGTATLHKIKNSKTDELSTRLESVEQTLLRQRKIELAANVMQAKNERAAQLAASAERARKLLAPELAQRADAAAELAARADALRGEFKLQVAPDFKENLHPRGDDGKFRTVLLKLNEILGEGKSTPEAEGAKKDLEKAADLEEKGDADGAAKAAADAKDKLESAADTADTKNDQPAGDKLHDAAGDVADAVAEVAGDAVQGAEKATKDAAKDVAKGDAPVPDAVEKADDAPGKSSKADAPVPDISNDDIPEEIKNLIESIVDELGEGVDPQSVVSRLDSKAKHWFEGKGFESPEAMAKQIEKMMQRPLQPGITQ